MSIEWALMVWLASQTLMVAFVNFKVDRLSRTVNPQSQASATRQEPVISHWPEPGSKYSATIRVPGVVLLKCDHCGSNLGKRTTNAT